MCDVSSPKAMKNNNCRHVEWKANDEENGGGIESHFTVVDGL